MSTNGSHKAKVLIVDDEKSIRTTLREFLLQENYDVDVAEDSSDAQAQLDQKSYDVVVSDIILPRVSGVDLLKQIRKKAPDVQVIMMTGEPALETAVEAVRAGACDYLTKPVDKSGILWAVANATRIKKLEDDKLRLEAENLQYQKNLEQRVEDRTRDLSEALDKLKKAQQNLIQQERMNALGQMASGIAHDFNNVLMPIVGFSDMLLSDPKLLDDREETIHLLEMIRSASEDARHIVRRMRKIYKDEDYAFSLVDLAKALESVISITMPKWKEEMNAKGGSIVVKTDFKEVPLVKGNNSELREAFINLIFNAVDAMPDGGTITLCLRLEHKRGVVCDVCDTGIGMNEATLSRCLEPFFTTKGSQGTGLGLPMIHAIVKRHGGNMKINSKTGVGTTVQMLFPVSAEIETFECEAGKELEPLPPLRILVIDDEARSRSFIARILKAEGHDFTTAGSGQDGLYLFRRGQFDMVITDRAMPLMSGDEVAAKVTELRPDIPVIMLTGFGDIIKDTNEIPSGVTRVATKPISQSDLRYVMSSVMSESGKM